MTTVFVTMVFVTMVFMTMVSHVVLLELEPSSPPAESRELNAHLQAPPQGRKLREFASAASLFQMLCLFSHCLDYQLVLWVIHSTVGSQPEMGQAYVAVLCPQWKHGGRPGSHGPRCGCKATPVPQALPGPARQAERFGMERPASGVP